MIRRAIGTAVMLIWIAAVCAGVLDAQASSLDLSGVWHLDRSQPGTPGTGILDVSLSIEHRGAAVTFKRVATVQGGVQLVLAFTATTDGTVVKVKGRYQAELDVSCRIEDGRLVIQRQQDGIRVIDGRSERLLYDVKEVFEFSADRSIVTVTETSIRDGGSVTRKTVLRRTP